MRFSVIMKYFNRSKLKSTCLVLFFCLFCSANAFSAIVITTESFQFGETGRWYYAIPATDGGTAPYTWSISEGTIPDGLSFDPVTGRIWQYPTNAGDYSFTLKVQDTNGLSAEKSFSLIIYDPLAIPNLPTVYNILEKGSTYNLQMSPTGGLPPYTWTITSGTLPEGLTFDSATGTLAGTLPSAGYNQFYLQLSDSKGSYFSKQFTFYVVNPLVVTYGNLSSTSLPFGVTGTSYSQFLQASGSMGYGFTWSISQGRLPAGLTLSSYGSNSQYHVVTGIPTESGSFNFTVQVTDGYLTTEKSFPLVINYVPPTFGYSNGFLDYLIAGQNYNIPSNATGGIPPYNFSKTTGDLPTGMTLNSSNGQLTGIPTTTGKTSFTVQLDDEQSATTARTFPTTVYPGNIKELLCISNQQYSTYDIAIDSSGYLYATGNGGTTKYDFQGNVIKTWADLKGRKIALDTQGNIYLSNYIYSPLSFVTSKYDATGKLLWSVTHDNSFSDQQTINVSLATDNNGNSYYFGNYASGAVITVKYDSSGNIVWERVNESTEFRSGVSMSATKNGDVYIICDSGRKLIKFDTFGNQLWVKTSPNGTSYYSVGIDNLSNIYLSGATYQNSNRNFTNKLDIEGNLLWSKEYSFGMTIYFPETVVDENGIIYITYLAIQEPGHMVRGLFTVAFDCEGNRLGMRSYASTDYLNNMAGQIATDNQGNIYVISQSRTPRNDFIFKYRLQPFLTTSFLPSGTTGLLYSQTLDTKSGRPPYNWTLVAGALPSGLTLNSSTGEVFGTPSVSGSYSFTIKVTDSTDSTTSSPVKLIIADTVCTDGDKDGFSVNGGTCGAIDCDDSNASINPGTYETPYNGTDENCNGMLDDDDIDQDGFSKISDCNDMQASIHPGAVEIPYNGIDENCNGTRDDNDLDGDGYLLTNDCNDTDPTINPAATEIFYNSVDENCNGMADNDDLDHDGYNLASDCNDNDSAINSNAVEIPYNSIDENCNGMADDSDFDRDGYDYTTDCNDNDPTTHPGAVETPYNGADENCNGMADDTDYDGDGYDYTIDCNDNNPAIHPGADEIPYNSADENCNGMADDTDYDGDGYDYTIDCNDNNPAIHPGVDEIHYNGVDENCNGMADDDDIDQDGYAIALDCNDNEASINPGAVEIPYNGIDENCSGLADDDDLDLDGFGITTDCNDNDPTINPASYEIFNNGIDENCNGMADDTDASVMVDGTTDTLQQLPIEALLPPTTTNATNDITVAENRIGALQNMITNVSANLETVNDTMTIAEKLAIYEGCLLDLNDILVKTDGFYGGNPENDWITTQEGQDMLHPQVQNAITFVQGEISKITTP